jgi:hypothetical protein
MFKVLQKKSLVEHSIVGVISLSLLARYTVAAHNWRVDQGRFTIFVSDVSEHASGNDLDGWQLSHDFPRSHGRWRAVRNKGLTRPSWPRNTQIGF